MLLDANFAHEGRQQGTRNRDLGDYTDKPVPEALPRASRAARSSAPAAPNSVLPADARSVLTTKPEVRSDNWKQQTRKGGQFGKKSKRKAASGSKVSRRTEQVSEEPANTTQGSCSAVLPNDSALPKHIHNSVDCDAVCALLPTPPGQPLQGIADAVRMQLPTATGKCPIFFFHNESTVRVNDKARTYWGDGSAASKNPAKKSEAAAYMISDFMAEEAEALKVLHGNKPGLLDGPGLDNAEMSQTPEEHIAVGIEVGVNKDGYWRNGRFQKQMWLFIDKFEEVFDATKCNLKCP